MGEILLVAALEPDAGRSRSTLMMLLPNPRRLMLVNAAPGSYPNITRFGFLSTIISA